jgi:ANTAR domain
VIKQWVPSGPVRTRLGRRVLDTAEGILIGLRRCDTDAALQELVTASRTHGVAVFAIASALVDLAGGADKRQISERMPSRQRDANGGSS